MNCVTHDVVDADARPQPSRFWTGSICIVRPCTVGFIILYLILIYLLSSTQTHRTRALISMSVLAYLAASNVFALIGYLRGVRKGWRNRPLMIYIIMQTVFITAGVTGVGYLAYVSWWLARGVPERAIPMLMFCLFLILGASLPLCLLCGRGAWYLIVKPPPTTDSSGRYLNCVACGYDLRGTTGPMCPECGKVTMMEASV